MVRLSSSGRAAAKCLRDERQRHWVHSAAAARLNYGGAGDIGCFTKCAAPACDPGGRDLCTCDGRVSAHGSRAPLPHLIAKEKPVISPAAGLQASLYARAVNQIEKSNLAPEKKTSLMEGLDSRGGADHRISKSQFQFAKEQLRIAKFEDHFLPPPRLPSTPLPTPPAFNPSPSLVFTPDLTTQPLKKVAQPSTSES
jgi:hypothetical protein